MLEGTHGWPYPGKRLGNVRIDTEGNPIPGAPAASGTRPGRQPLKVAWDTAQQRMEFERVVREQLEGKVTSLQLKKVIEKLWPGLGDVAEGSRPRSRPQRNWDGQTNSGRKRKLQEQKKEQGFVELWKLQMALNKLSSFLQGFHVEDYKLDEVSLMTLDELYDDLVSMSEWRDRTIHSVQARLSDHEVRAKIAKLRDTTGRTPAEAQTALALAARLEAKLEARLASA